MVELTGAHRWCLTTACVASDQRIDARVSLCSDAERTIVRRPDGTYGAVDHIESRLPFKEPDLKVKRNIGSLAAVKVGSAPLNIEDSVRRGSTDRSEDAQVCPCDATTGTSALIRPIGEDCIRSPALRDAACGEGIVDRTEGQMAIGAYRSGCKILTIEVVGEWEGNNGGGIIGVIARIGRSRNDAPSADGI